MYARTLNASHTSRSLRLTPAPEAQGSNALAVGCWLQEGEERWLVVLVLVVVLAPVPPPPPPPPPPLPHGDRSSPLLLPVRLLPLPVPFRCDELLPTPLL